jgi:hypothetical protein
MNPINIKLQAQIVELLSYISYWDSINTALAWGMCLSFVAGAIFTGFAVAMVTGEIPQCSSRDKATATTFAGTFVTLFFVFLISLIFVPSGSANKSSLMMYTSQMTLDEQGCNFIKGLHENNRDYSSNVTIPKQCRNKKDIDDE